MPRALLLRLSLAAAMTLASLPAFAQAANVCGEGQKLLMERQTLMQQWEQMSGGGKKKVDPRPACGLFNKIVSNSNATLKWLEVNKDWCQVPDGFAQAFKAGHDTVVKTRGQACDVAAKMNEMQKQAQKPGQGMLGGTGLTGEYKIPQGAL